MSGPRVYGTWLDPATGVRHDASGVKDGTFARALGAFDTITTCGKYVEGEPDKNGLAPTCLRCLGKRSPTGILRTTFGRG